MSDELPMSPDDGFEIQHQRTGGLFLVTIVNMLTTLLFLLLCVSAVVGRHWAMGAFFGAFGLFLAYAVLNMVRASLSRRLVATVDRRGITFATPTIKDYRFRRWSWDEIDSIEQQTTSGRYVTVRDLYFALRPSPRVEAFRESLPRRNIFGVGRDKQLQYATTVRFSIGVRPDRDDTIARLFDIAPQWLVG